MSYFNPSAWAVRHSTLTLFFIAAIAVAGIFSFFSLGRAEDPDFTIKAMVVTAVWPGATAREVELQVTDRLEKKLQETPYHDNIVSYSKPGEAVLKLELRQETPPALVPEIWYQVRKKVEDIKNTLPAGVQGPFFNDEFGDTYSMIYAFSADGFSNAELKNQVEQVRQELMYVKNISKIDIFGAQDRKIFVEFSHRKLALLSVTMDQIFDSLKKHGAVAAAGVIDTPSYRIPLRVESDFNSLEGIHDLPITTGDRTLRLGDIATVTAGYEDPQSFTMRFQGKPVIGLGVAMTRDGNIQHLGEALDAAMARIKANLPAGIEVEQVANQPKVVDESIAEFVRSLAEALAIVLAISFLSLGLRSGIVIACSVPLVLAMTFVAMEIMGISLHRISLGALIIALGLLVDDAIIAVEMMMVKLEEGCDRLTAATFAYTSTGFPMLTGTLVTATGFLPVGFAKSDAGEFTNSIFWVVGIALVASWLVAVLFAPFLGYKILSVPKKAHHRNSADDDRFQLMMRAVVIKCITWRKTMIAATLICFGASIYGFGLVQQQFFPSASRPELIVDLRLAETSSFAATAQAVEQMEHFLARDENVATYTAYTGGGAPRFFLSFEPEQRNANFAQFVVVTKGLDEREVLFKRLRAFFDNDMGNLRGRVTRLENGPPVGYPVQFRVIGKDPETIRKIAGEVSAVMRANPHTRDVNFEWNELGRSVNLVVDHTRAYALGVNPQDLSNTLNTMLTGFAVTQVRDGVDLIDIVARAVPSERLNLDTLDGINIRTTTGATVPLAQVASIRYELEEPILWRRNRETMLNVRADIADDTQAPVVSAEIDTELASIRAQLPDRYRIDVGGAVEESEKGQDSLNAVMPVMVLLMVTILMIQLQSFSLLALVLLTAPLGLIGICTFLLAFDRPFGFVAMLGMIALAGMIMRNSVILVDQISQDIKAGRTPWDAVVEATVRRARPIFLTAAASILAMIPLSRSTFWGPMAVTIMGGLAVATLLTVLFVPALYAAWFRIPQPAAIPADGDASELDALADEAFNPAE